MHITRSIKDAAESLGKGKEIRTDGGWLTCCPVHGDDTPSLSIKSDGNGGVLVNCHAGCNWRAVKDEMKALGLITSSRINNLPDFIWNKSNRNDQAIKKYLSSRNINLDPIPKCLRLNKHNDQMIMVAEVRKPGDGELVAIHRTFLDEDYKKTGRKMLGKCGSRAVWLSDPAEKMLIGEGIETTLAAMVATGIPGAACLSAAGIKMVVIPDKVKEIIILVDSDPNQAGQKAAKSLANRFTGKVMSATPDDTCFTDNPNKLDFNDLDPDLIRERFENLTIETVEKREPEITLFDEDGKPKTKATVLIEIGSLYELFHDETGEGYATITWAGHKETWPIRSKVFTELLADQYFLLANKGVSRVIISDATDTLRGKARVHGEQHKVYRRVAALDGKIFIDLCDAGWRVVEVSADSWRVVTDSPIKFLRSPSSLELPEPHNGGDISDLWELINVKPADRPLVAGFLVRALQPDPPYFGIAVVGEQGTGKSFTAKVLRALNDPSTSMLRPPPKDDRDFLAGAANNWCLTYDNLSGLQPWLSDSLCRVLTGGSFAARTLYTTIEETTIPLSRPVILNGIDDLTSRPDLADRTIVIELQPIMGSNRVEERKLWEIFNSISNKVFGVILSGICSALRTVDKTELSYKPRMLDAAKWATAAEEGMGLESGSFIESYKANQRDMVSISLESSPFIAALLDMVKEKKEWSGTPTELQALLPGYARDDEAVRSKAWPKSPAWITKVIRRHAPSLRKIGVDVEQSRDSESRHIRIMTEEPKNLTPHGQGKENVEPKQRDLHFEKSTVTTVIPSPDQGSYDSNDSNDGRNLDLLDEDLEDI